MIKKCAALLLAIMMIAGCGDTPAEGNPIIPPPEAEAETEYRPQAEPEPPDEPETESVFPFIPEDFDLDETFPTMFHLDGNFDTSLNNHTHRGMSFFLDDQLFGHVEWDSDYLMLFDSVQGSAVGPMRVSVIAEPIGAVPYLVVDSEGGLQQVWTLNALLASFVGRLPGEVYSYFSETIRGHYIPAAIFFTDHALGLIFWITDVEYVDIWVEDEHIAGEGYIYSIQFLSFDPAYAPEQNQVIFDLLNSIRFS